MKIKQTPFYFRLVDFLLTPVMFFVGGFKKENIQHHHGYHAINCSLKLDLTKCIEVMGDDSSKYESGGGFASHLGLFHMPIIGGWKNYIVLKNEDFSGIWFIGWKTSDFFQYTTLNLKQPFVKILKGKKGTKGVWFGLDKNGNQVLLSKVAEGVLGDGKYKNAPLY